MSGRRRSNTLPLPGFEQGLPLIEATAMGTAHFSPCGRFRYRLTRPLGDASGRHGTVLFILLNPSVANAEKNDPTASRCVSFGRAWGFAELVIANLCAMVSTDASALADVVDPVGPSNDRYLLDAAMAANLVVCGWGDGGGSGAGGMIVTARRGQVCAMLASRADQAPPRRPDHAAAQPRPPPVPPRRRPSRPVGPNLEGVNIMKRLILILSVLAACGGAADDAAAPDAGPCTCAFALCRSDGTCWCPTDAGTREECGPSPASTNPNTGPGL